MIIQVTRDHAFSNCPDVYVAETFEEPGHPDPYVKELFSIVEKKSFKVPPYLALKDLPGYLQSLAPTANVKVLDSLS